MSLEAAMKFVSKMAEDDILRAQVAKAVEGKNEDVAANAFSALGRQHGFVFSASNALVVYHRAMKLAQQQRGVSEMSTAELAQVSGGMTIDATKPMIPDFVSLLKTPSH